MKKVFADTGYFIALLIDKEALHDKATVLAAELRKDIVVTTELVLEEFLNFYAKRGPFIRKKAVESASAIKADSNFYIFKFSELSFDEGLRFYRSRLDKNYSFTDCISMVIMEEQDITEVLSNDRHFEQEGFTRLLK